MKKLLTFAFAAAFAFTATAASAATVEELQAQIDALLAQLSEMSSTTSTTTSGYTFNNDLTIGSEGADVIALQSFLESKGVLMVPAGVSKGYFGTLTQAALASYQAMVGIAPASGYFGPITRANVNASAVVTTPGTTTTTTSTNSGLSGGEASLEDFDFESEDDAEEGKMTHVATASFDVEDADAEINRVDISFDNSGVGAGADDEPWDVFETIYLAIDGDVIAEEDIDDEDDWLDDDNNPLSVFRISDIDLIIEEDDEAEIEIWLDTSNNVDVPANADWEIFIDDEGIRAVDSEGVQSYTGDDGDTVTFNMDEEGGDEEIVLKSSSSDPDSFVIEVDEDDDSSWEEVFVFGLEAEENDIDIEDIEITVTTGTAAYADVVDDIELRIDGESFDDDTRAAFDTGAGAGGIADDGIENGTEDFSVAELTFDIDEDYTIDADDTEKVSVWVKIKQQGDGDGTVTGDPDDNYDVGETIFVTATAVSGEGVDDVSDTGSIDGETHSLEISVADITFDGFTVDKAEDDASGTISFEFTIDASDSEDDIDFNVVNKADVNGASDDVRFTLTGTDITIGTASITLLDGDATSDLSGWVIDEGGEEAVFVVDVTFTTIDALGGDNGTYRVRLDSVEGQEIDETSSGMTLSN